MATSTYQRVGPVYSALDSATAIAQVLLKMTDAVSPHSPYVRDISAALAKLWERGFKVRDLGLRKTAGGYYSEDVETFVGQLLSIGYATQRSPIRLTSEGRNLCAKILESEKNKEQLQEFRSLLDGVLTDSITA